MPLMKCPENGVLRGIKFLTPYFCIFWSLRTRYYAFLEGLGGLTDSKVPQDFLKIRGVEFFCIPRPNCPKTRSNLYGVKNFTLKPQFFLLSSVSLLNFQPISHVGSDCLKIFSEGDGVNRHFLSPKLEPRYSFKNFWANFRKKWHRMQ